MARRRWGRAFGRALLVLVLGCAALVNVAWWRLTATVTQLPGSAFNRGQNAIWVAHTWSGDPHSEADYDGLAAELKHAQIRYIFAHVGPLENDGTIPPERYPYARNFAAAMHERLPGVQILAWLGQIYRIGALPTEQVIDISVPQTRQQAAETSAIFTGLGFDGIHYDLEPIVNNDNHFLDLLALTRKAIGARLISVATPNWVPVARLSDAMDSLTGRQDTWWTTFYYGRVSQFVDQIVVMLYNTGMPTAPLYEAAVEQSTAHIIRAVEDVHDANPPQVVIGIPVYRGPDSRAFHAAAENMRTGLTGLTAGLNYDPAHTAFGGVAIYPEWLVTPSDWQTYDQLWLGSH